MLMEPAIVTAIVRFPFTTAVPELSGAVLLGTYVPDPQPALASGSFCKEIYVDMNKLKVYNEDLQNE